MPKKVLGDRSQPNGSDPVIERMSRSAIELMSSKLFRHSIVNTVDRQALAIGELHQLLQTTREFLADLSARVDALDHRLHELESSPALTATH